MKKIENNNKGFTLIELLAVIVILAIILVIVVPKVFNTIDSSKKRSLINSAKGAASAWETKLASQILDSDGIGTNIGTFEANGIPRCITRPEANIIGISENDYVIELGDGGTSTISFGFNNILVVDQNTCSTIREVGTFDDDNNWNGTGKILIVLVAKNGGSIYIDSATQGNIIMYASSDGHNSWEDGKQYSMN